MRAIQRSGPILGLLLLAAGATFLVVQPGPDPMAHDVTRTPAPSETEFRAWFDYIVPGQLEDEWTDIAWRPRVWEGVLDAHKADKPLLIWIMRGHPLGFT